MATLQLDPEVRSAVSTTVLFVPALSRDRVAVAERLTRCGVAVTRVPDIGEALRLLAVRSYALCLVDLADERSAIASIRACRTQHPQMPVVGIIDPARPLVAAEAIHVGVSDVLPWPFEERDVAAVVANARDRLSVGPADHGASGVNGSNPLFAHSPAMRQVTDLIRSAAASRAGVLVCGERSTGREIVARAIHAADGRPDGPFVLADCGAGSPEEVEERLFGIPPERSTQSVSRRAAERIGRSGAVYQARGGTLFLTNLPDAPARVQVKLARLIRDAEAALNDKRVIIDLDVRPIAAVDPAPEVAVAEGRLRRDLHERLSTFRIDVPALRRRREDIPLLAVHFLRQLSQEHGRSMPRLSRSALALLGALPWPANCQELRTLLETLAVSVTRPVIELDDVLEHVKLDGIVTRIDVNGTLRDAKARFERDWIAAVLVKHHGRVGDAARALGIQRTNLYRKVRQLNVARSLLGSRKA